MHIEKMIFNITPYKCIGKQTWPCHKKDQIIWANLLVPNAIYQDSS